MNVFRKLSAFFTMIAFIIFSSTWLVRRLLGMNAVDVMTMFTQSVVIIITYFIIGIFLARLGVALVNEYLMGKRAGEAERRERARSLYLAALATNKTGLNEAALEPPVELEQPKK